MTYVAGIDYDSEAIHVALVDLGTGALEAVVPRVDLAAGPGDAFARARRVSTLFPAGHFRPGGAIQAVALELPFSRQTSSLAPLMRVQGAILACIPRDFDVREIRPQVWKSLTVGKSNASKDDVIEWSLYNGAPTGLEVDFYDAFGIARALRLAILDPTVSLRPRRKPRKGGSQ